jgi:hypothetical protein
MDSAGETTAQIVAFLREIGLRTEPRTIAEPTVLPGIAVVDGTIAYDEAKLVYPGDLLHEAGHLAVMTPAHRATASHQLDATAGAEIAALAWSYAASVRLGLDPAIVFHDAGYRGAAESLRTAFASGATLGQPVLRWLGLTDDGYPGMLRWLNESDREPAG